MRLGCLLSALVVAGCPARGPAGPSTSTADGEAPRVDVVGVRATGGPESWTFYVELRSDETGCERYADWWEVLTPDGALVYRRILEHSHPDEQPFERSGGPVEVGGADELVVRGHLHPQGYVGTPMRGTVDGGFTAWDPPAGFAAGLEETPPLPADCLF